MIIKMILKYHKNDNKNNIKKNDNENNENKVFGLYVAVTVQKFK